MKTFKQFLTESRSFDKVEAAMELFDDDIKFVRRDKGVVVYEMTEPYWKSFTEEKLKKLQSYFGDDVFILYGAKTGHLMIYKAVRAEVVGLRFGVNTLDMHDQFLEDTLDYIERRDMHIAEKELYCDREVADQINVTDEVLFLTDDGILVLSGGTSWNTSLSNLIVYKEFNDLIVSDIVFLFFDEEASDRIKRFKYLGTKK